LKTLAEIAIEAGLVTKDNAVKAGRIAAQKQEPLVAILVRELGVDEVALIGALRKQTRVPLIDPVDAQFDPDALRLVTRDVCYRLRVLPLGVGTEGSTKVLRIAMADPTDAAAILEMEHITHCEIEVTALPLSAIEELLDKGYKAFSTAVRQRPRGLSVITRKTPIENDPEVSVTAQIPLESLRPDPGLEQRFAALCQLLVGKGIVTEAELLEALKKAGS
jgi:hypothetical protein